MTTLLPIILAAALGGWALLSLVGGERTRRVNEAEAVAEVAAKLAAATKSESLPVKLPNSSTPLAPVISKPSATASSKAPVNAPVKPAPVSPAKPAGPASKAKASAP